MRNVEGRMSLKTLTIFKQIISFSLIELAVWKQIRAVLGFIALEQDTQSTSKCNGKYTEKDLQII